jgi:hypothetical protein
MKLIFKINLLFGATNKIKIINMNYNKITIPYHLIIDIKSKINQKYEKSLLKKNNIDSNIFLNKKVINILSKYTLLKSQNKLTEFDLNVNNIENKITINNESYILYGYVEKDDFVYIKKDTDQSKYIIIKFQNNLRFAQVVYHSILEGLISDFDLALSDKQLKISINKIEGITKKYS